VTISVPFGKLAVGFEQQAGPFDASVHGRAFTLQFAPDLGA
jgi:hypothetical protein